jgi:hypothetical protein
MLRWLVIVLLACFSACAKQPDLPDTIVRAASAEELTSFRADLGAHFAADRLQTFDTALQELKLDAMSRSVATADAREQDMRAVVNGQTVHAAEILGWQARRTRVLSEIALLAGLLERDLQRQQQTAATGTPLSVTTHIQNEQDILERLHRNLTDTESHLTTLGAPPGPAPR